METQTHPKCAFKVGQKIYMYIQVDSKVTECVIEKFQQKGGQQ